MLSKWFAIISKEVLLDKIIIVLFDLKILKGGC